MVAALAEPAGRGIAVYHLPFYHDSSRSCEMKHHNAPITPASTAMKPCETCAPPCTSATNPRHSTRFMDSEKVSQRTLKVKMSVSSARLTERVACSSQVKRTVPAGHREIGLSKGQRAHQRPACEKARAQQRPAGNRSGACRVSAGLAVFHHSTLLHHHVTE